MRKVLALALLLLTTVLARPLVEEDNRFFSEEAANGMVVAGEAQAARVGRLVLEQGGNAVDAAIATAFALSVTLPRAGNLGGGGFLLVRTPEGQVYALDFRETAPGRAHRDMYLDEAGQAVRQRSTVGALAVGVPGTVAGLEAAAEKFGSLPWEQLLKPSIALAEKGITVGPWLERGLTATQERMVPFEASRAVFFPQGRPLQAGERLIQKDLGATLRRVAEQGSADFYRGQTANLLVQGLKQKGGLISLEDLAAYRPVWRAPVHGTFRGYDVYSMPPPSSGGIHLVQILNILEEEPFDVDTHNSSNHLHLLAEAMRSAFADRSRWLGDPDFTEIPQQWLVSKAYAARIRKAIPDHEARISSDVQPGQPSESTETTHLCTVDRNGWSVSLTTTLNFSYGCGYMAPGTGFLLNNEMDDFSAAPGQPNAYGLVGGEANSIEPGKRPLSSMTPTIVARDGKLVAVLGAPGGSRIITSVTQALLNTLGFGFNAQSSVALPRIHHQWLPDKLFYEQGVSLDTRKLLAGMGHRLERIYAVGHVMLIKVRPDGHLEGGADPRRPASIEGH